MITQNSLVCLFICISNLSTAVDTLSPLLSAPHSQGCPQIKCGSIHHHCTVTVGWRKRRGENGPEVVSLSQQVGGDHHNIYWGGLLLPAKGCSCWPPLTSTHRQREKKRLRFQSWKCSECQVNAREGGGVKLRLTQDVIQELERSQSYNRWYFLL